MRFLLDFLKNMLYSVKVKRSVVRRIQFLFQSVSAFFQTRNMVVYDINFLPN